MIYAEVLEVESIQSTRIPSKPTINNLLRHSRSEENIMEGEGNPSTSSSTREISLCVESPPSSSASNLPTTVNSSMDLHIGSDCWSQEDDEISLQVWKYTLFSLHFWHISISNVNALAKFCNPVPSNEVKEVWSRHDISNESRLLWFTWTSVRLGNWYSKKTVGIIKCSEKYLPAGSGRSQCVSA